MKTGLKKAISIITAAAMIFTILLIAGCSKQDNSQGPADKSATEKKVEKKEEKIVLRSASPYPNAQPQYAPRQEVVDKFIEKYPNVEIQQENMASTQYHDKLKTEIASDTLPDVFLNWGGGEVRDGVEAGLFMDLTELLNSEPEFKNLLMPGALTSDAVTYVDMKGLWGIPYSGAAATGFFYNKEIFDKVGVQPPKTWDEFLTVVNKLKDSGVIPWSLGAKDGWRAEHVWCQIFYKRNGTQPGKDLATRKMKYSDPIIIETFKIMEELRDMEAFGPNPASVDHATEQSMFMNGKSAMDFHLNHYYAKFTQPDSPIKDKIGWFPFPYFTDKPEFKDSKFAGVSSALSLNAKLEGKKKELAWELLKGYAGEEGQKGQVVKASALPTIKIDNLESLYPTDVQKQIYKDYISAKDFMLDITQLDKVPSLLNKLRSVCTGLLNKQLTAEQAGKEMDHEIEISK